MSKKNEIQNMAGFLFETGLLFEINRRVLNPFGLNLTISIDDYDDNDLSLGPLLDHREEDVGIIMSQDMLEDGIEQFAKFLKDFGQEKLNNRMKELGFIEQRFEQLSDLDLFELKIKDMDVEDL